MSKRVIERIRTSGMMSAADATEAFKTVTSCIAAEIRDGGSVRLQGIGTLKRAAVGERSHVVPGSDERVRVQAHDAVKLTRRHKFGVEHG